MVAFTSAVAPLRSRSMKIERCSRASVPNSGQPAISDFATKESGRRLPKTRMSSQETWLESTSVGVSFGGCPTCVTRTPSAHRPRRWNATGITRAMRQWKRTPSACGPIRTASASRTNPS